MAKAPKPSDPGWKISDALVRLRAGIDPYLWDQGQELHRRQAVEDFQMLADGAIQVTVLDPRDSRRFFVRVERSGEGIVRSRCECPYRLGGYCRHQVVALQYLRRVAEGSEEAASEGAAGGGPAGAAGTAGATARPAESALYRLSLAPGFRTAPDGSLLRVALHSLGSLRTAHRIGLQVFTGTGWTEFRGSEVDRWIARGDSDPHPRDLALARLLVADGPLRTEVDSETLGRILSTVVSTSALVDRSGTAIQVSPWPFRLGARLERSAGVGLAVKLVCRPGEGREAPFEEVALVPSVAPWIQLESGAFHPLVSGVAGPVLAELQEEDWSEVSGEALDRLLGEGLAALETICLGTVEEDPGLIEEVEGVSGARLRLEGSPAKLSGRLELLYGEEWIDATKARAPFSSTVAGVVRRYPPAGGSLSRAQRDLEAVGFREAGGIWAIQGPSVVARVLEPRPKAFVRIELPEKLAPLDLVGRAPALELHVRAPPPVEGEGFGGPSWRGGAGGGGPGEGREPPEGTGFRPRSGIAWLEVAPVLRDGDREVSVDLEALRLAVRERPEGVLELSDGTILGLGHPAVRSLAGIGEEAIPAGGDEAAPAGTFRMPVASMARLLGDLPGCELRLDGAARALAEDLRGAASAAVVLDPRTEATLRPYQKDAVRWLSALARWRLGGILADEMGLGKTLMALAHFFGRADAAGAATPARGTVLVVCPSSLVFNWLDEARRFFPDLRAEGLHGESAASRERIIGRDLDLLVTSYALLRRDREALEAREFRAVVLDEAHHVKNPESQTADAAFALRAGERWALTGTPVENHLGELWSLFRFAMPGFLGDAAAFARTYAEPIARGDSDALGDLRARVRPFLLRRTKAQVLGDLPPLIEQVERVPLGPAQRALYEAFLAKARGDLEGSDPGKSRFQILAALTRLRQICCHPRLVLDRSEEAPAATDEALEGGKFDLLRELLETAVEEEHRVLLYSQFTSMLDLIEELLAELGIRRARLDGSTRDREGEVRKFAGDPSIPVFLISLKAGGLGLNLTQADTVILYDPWWNPAAEAQAAARAHRIGQTVPVHVHKLITVGTVEEKILELQASKRGLAASVIEGSEDPLAALSVEDLRAILG